MQRLLVALAVGVALSFAVSVTPAKADSIDSGSGGCWCGGESPPSTWGWGLQTNRWTGEQHYVYCYGAPFNGGYC